MPRLKGARNITLVAVGDDSSKKAELLSKYTSDRRFESSVFINNVQEIIVDHIPYSVYFMDSESGDDYKTLRQYAYVKADCFLLCYSIANRESFNNIIKKWCIEIRKKSSAPIVLVGTEAEKRSSDSLNFITTQEGGDLKFLIDAAAFVECSIDEFVGVDNVFIEAIRSLYKKLK